MRLTKNILMDANKVKNCAAGLSSEEKNRLLHAMSEALIEDSDIILTENTKDIEMAKDSISEVMIDRLTLNRERLSFMAQAICEVEDLPDPVGNIISEYVRPNGLQIQRVSVPIGVVAIIYESRPNVTADAAALLIKSGNVCVLRPGKEAYRTSKAIVSSLQSAAEKCGLPRELFNITEDTTRQSAIDLMEATGLVDLLIPRGGAGLIAACVENAKVPCIETGTGICHVYIDREADMDKAVAILENAKKSRPSVCNAAEVCLIDRPIANVFLPLMQKKMLSGAHPVELRLDAESMRIIKGKPAEAEDYDTEFLDYILAVKIVDGVQEAVAHIAAHSTGHSEAIVTENDITADYFLKNVDSAAVYHNASTRFTDGGEFGLGCEMGISTQKIHARGPMGLEALCSYKYIIRGNGQIR